jgi:hypothetical protein
MPRSLPRDHWIAEATERFARIDAWRQAHPTATWAEIEAAIDAQLGPLRAEVLGSLEPRLAQLRYATFRAQGLPIGSGIVESANKLVVEARLKGAGRRWAEGNVTPMVALRGAVCSDRWAEAWVAIAGSRRRAHRAQPTAGGARLGPTASAASVAAPVRRTPSPAITTVPRPGTKTIRNGRPTASHPWKRYPRIPPPAPAKR